MTSHPPEKNPDSSPSGSEPEKEDRFRLNLRQLRAASAGWNFVTAPLVGGALGYGVDWLLPTYPWFMIAGIVLGFVSAFIDLLRSAR